MSRVRPSRRARALRFLRSRAGITEQPPGSNRDNRARGITWMQRTVAGGGSWLIGLPWCGVACAAAAMHAGLQIPQPWRWASVAAIEDDARARRNALRGWTRDIKRARKGDLIVLFRRGQHVETIASTSWAWRRLGCVLTYGGNTSSGNTGSQDNGGGLFRRIRRIADIHGIALIDY